MQLLARIKSWAQRRRQELAASRAAVAAFEALVDPTYLDRATAKPIQVPKYNAIYGKEK